MTELRGLVLTVFDQERSGTIIALPLTGSIDQDGFYMIGNVTGAGKRSTETLCIFSWVCSDCIYPLLPTFLLLRRSDFPREFHSAGTRSGSPML